MDTLIGKDDAGVGTAQGQRPQVLGNPNLGFGNRTAAEWFNPAEWVAPPLGTFATTGRNLVSIPGTNNWDMSMIKDTPITERLKAQFRAEFFSAFNHPNFTAPTLNVQSPQFGEVLGAGGSRQIQFALKLLW